MIPSQIKIKILAKRVIYGTLGSKGKKMIFSSQFHGFENYFYDKLSDLNANSHVLLEFLINLFF